MLTRIKALLQYAAIIRCMKASRIKGYERLETGNLYPAIRKKLFNKGYEEYTQGGILSEKRYFWTTSPVEQSPETAEQEG